jgi:putative membrane protein
MKTKNMFQVSILALAIGCTLPAIADVSMSDSHFLQKAAQAGNYEVKGSELAVKKSKNTDVQSFAKQMVDDHTKAGEEVKALAAKKKVKVSAEPSFTQKTSLMLLEKKDGHDFDESYAENVGVDAHKSTVKLFEKAAKSADDPEIKEFANKTLPTLNHHLKMAKELDEKVDKQD